LAKIQAAATTRGMSIEKISEEVTKSGAKVAKSTLYRWGASNPNPHNLKAEADVLGLSLDSLLKLAHTNNTIPTHKNTSPLYLDFLISEDEQMVMFNGQLLFRRIPACATSSVTC
jgi:hypothetical protein